MIDSGHDSPRTGLRRLASRKVAVGIGGVAFVGAGAIMTAGIAGDNEHHEVTSTISRPDAEAGVDFVTATAGPGTIGRADGAPADETPTDEPSLSTSQRVAQAKAAKKVPVLRPLPEKVNPVPQSQIHVRQVTGLREGYTLRIVSAKGDLTAQAELAWVDGGHRAGRATCTQDFRFSGDTPAQRRPTMLVCWQTSTAKSVYTVMIDQGGKPSEAASVAAIRREWRKLS